MYRVITVQAGCGGNVSHKRLEKVINEMTENGYRVVVVYEAHVGCCCPTKAAVLIFERR